MDRIEFIASLTKGLNSVVDLGCDHCYTLIDAVKKYGVNKGYGLDIAEGPIESAKKNIENENLSDKIDLVLSDGLKNFNNKADGLIITGMGGNLIVDILKYDLFKIKTFKKMIFSAQSDISKLRFFLINNMIKIENEYMIEDKGHIYEIIECSNEKIDRKYDYYDMMFGPVLRKEKSDLFIKKYTTTLNITKKAIECAKDKVQISRLMIEKAMLEEILK